MGSNLCSWVLTLSDVLILTVAFSELPISAVLEAPVHLKIKPWLKGKSLHPNCIFWYASAINMFKTALPVFRVHSSPKVPPSALVTHAEKPIPKICLLMSLEGPWGQWPPTQSSSQMKIECIMKRFCCWKVNNRLRGFLEMHFIPVPLVGCLLSLFRTLKFRPKKEHCVPRKWRKLGNAGCWYMLLSLWRSFWSC